jgi:Ca-activated chloride channel homolog
LTLAPDGHYEVESPDHTIESVIADDHGVVSGIVAPQTGVYSISQNGATPLRVGASLLSPRETIMSGVDQIQFNEQLQVAAAGETLKADWPLWPILVLVALAILLVEWWFFQKKPGGWK